MVDATLGPEEDLTPGLENVPALEENQEQDTTFNIDLGPLSLSGESDSDTEDTSTESDSDTDDDTDEDTEESDDYAEDDSGDESDDEIEDDSEEESNSNTDDNSGQESGNDTEDDISELSDIEQDEDSNNDEIDFINNVYLVIRDDMEAEEFKQNEGGLAIMEEIFIDVDDEGVLEGMNGYMVMVQEFMFMVLFLVLAYKLVDKMFK